VTDQELLMVAEAVLRDAVAEVEFTRKPKDLQYVLIVAQKVEDLRGKIVGVTPIKVERVYLQGARLVMELTQEGLGRCEAQP
jgi:hypothetical protein